MNWAIHSALTQTLRYDRAFESMGRVFAIFLLHHSATSSHCNSIHTSVKFSWMFVFMAMWKKLSGNLLSLTKSLWIWFYFYQYLYFNSFLVFHEVSHQKSKNKKSKMSGSMSSTPLETHTNTGINIETDKYPFCIG